MEEDGIPKALLEQRDLQSMQAEYETRSKTLPQDEEGKRRLDYMKAELEYRKQTAKDPSKLEFQVEEKRKILESKRTLANAVQQKILGMLSPEQEFKRVMSFTFAVLISFVILGFFVIALKDEKIRQAVFSGEAGIQFLTLFSLVIAIILFGITQILEGKELAALLGGLSGYILGRATPRKE